MVDVSREALAKWGVSRVALAKWGVRACSSMVEQLPLKQLVVGSSPTGRTTTLNGYAEELRGASTT
jgi:hypothetical protein